MPVIERQKFRIVVETTKIFASPFAAKDTAKRLAELFGPGTIKCTVTDAKTGEVFLSEEKDQIQHRGRFPYE